MGDHVPREMIIRSCSLRQNPAYRPGNSPSFLAWLLLLAVATACRTRVPEQVIVPSAPKPAPAEEVPRTWAPRADVLTREYRIEQRAQIIATLDAGGPQADSTSLITDASLRQDASSGTSGLVRTATVTTPGAPSTTLPGLVVPYAFAANDVPLGLQPVPIGRPPIQDPCTSTAHIPLNAVRDLLIHLPATLEIGKQWSDTGSFVTCRDGVRLVVSSHRDFRVLAYERQATGGVLKLERSARMTLRGQSVRGDDTTRVEGTGMSSMQYEIDAATGSVRSASGTGSLDVAVRGTLKSQRAKQTSTTLISLRAP